ncbi:DUF4397 domain-containing protein [Kribbella sandramycini]|uniref:DUF4397 domain-containing protein n=1 Tax=Kribbella sandramycini TaxID=60450 RepID=A0A7Y4L468_9ACTN|nr:DUF4397 domain-containing protein [Kribbella sandramycini]MBB6566197.1 hypothetical protein [Kribbella sandramycini]NOL43136.1 DUF4397 domain-containing protein [Kribbella sandramycini]
MQKQRVVDRLRPVFSRISGPVIGRSVLAALAALVPLLLATPSQAAAGASLYLVQGLPGQSLDLSVDGRQVAAKAPAAKVVGPIAVAAGQRTITARQGGKVVIERRVTVGSGGSLDVVIHQPAAPTGAPVITSYNNKLDAVPADKAAVRVAHTAAVGPADIRVNGKVLFANVANGESLDVVVPAATYRVEIVPAGASSPVVLGPLALPAKAGYLTRVFAVGAPASKTMTVAVGTIKLAAAGSQKPNLVNTGTGGQAAATDRSPLLVLVLLAGLAGAVAVRRVVRR